MPRGSKRPGAGAPRGNLNALKHGRRTYLHIDAMALALNTPPVRQSYVDHAVRQRARTPEHEARIRARVERHLDTLARRVNRALLNTNPFLVASSPDPDDHDDDELAEGQPRAERVPSLPERPLLTHADSPFWPFDSEEEYIAFILDLISDMPEREQQTIRNRIWGD